MGTINNPFTCQHCGANITEDMVYCEYCGCQITSFQPKAPQKIVINNYYNTPEKHLFPKKQQSQPILLFQVKKPKTNMYLYYYAFFLAFSVHTNSMKGRQD